MICFVFDVTNSLRSMMSDKQTTPMIKQRAITMMFSITIKTEKKFKLKIHLEGLKIHLEGLKFISKSLE